MYGYEDDISEQFHRELITPFVDPFEQAEEERIEEEKEQLRQLEIAKVRKVLEMLKPVQRERLIKAILLGMSSRKIAKEEGVYSIAGFYPKGFCGVVFGENNTVSFFYRTTDCDRILLQNRIEHTLNRRIKVVHIAMQY